MSSPAAQLFSISHPSRPITHYSTTEIYLLFLPTCLPFSPAASPGSGLQPEARMARCLRSTPQGKKVQCVVKSSCVDDVEDHLNFFQEQQYVHVICRCCVLYSQACLIQRQSLYYVQSASLRMNRYEISRSFSISLSASARLNASAPTFFCCLRRHDPYVLFVGGISSSAVSPLLGSVWKLYRTAIHQSIEGRGQC